LWQNNGWPSSAAIFSINWTVWLYCPELTAMTAPSIKVLIGEVAKRHGITLKPDDPAFALVTLNQLVLEHVMNELSEQTRNATREFTESLSRLQSQTGSILGAEVRSAASQIRQAFDGDKSARTGQSNAAPFREPRSVASIIRWAALGLAAGLALFALGVLAGRYWK
jgi:hypothetical protein